MDHLTDVFDTIVNFIHANGQKHREFGHFRNDEDVSHGLPCHTKVRWLSRAIVLKRFLELRGKIVILIKILFSTTLRIEWHQ